MSEWSLWFYHDEKLNTVYQLGPHNNNIHNIGRKFFKTTFCVLGTLIRIFPLKTKHTCFMVTILCLRTINIAYIWERIYCHWMITTPETILIIICLYPCWEQPYLAGCLTPRGVWWSVAGRPGYRRAPNMGNDLPAWPLARGTCTAHTALKAHWPGCYVLDKLTVCAKNVEQSFYASWLAAEMQPVI